jgi:hypothetical protein
MRAEPATAVVLPSLARVIALVGFAVSAPVMLSSGIARLIGCRRSIFGQRP